ncbi:uncharacterized protein LOC141666034 [Apium graveolens]|uniref:uncharacterized protein LOC141666034 n=1 Tax=Apium graveolens TaxID=4045 RepID=UPI003D798527
MVFDDFDLEEVKFPHDDPLFITPIIGNNLVKIVLVDNGASVDILLYHTFIRMGYNDSQSTPTDMPIYSFAGVECSVEGIIKLPLTMGQEARQATQILNFVVVKAGSTYNAIIGRIGIHAFKAVPSSYHFVIKFPTRDEIGEERGDQKMARSCYVASLRADVVGGVDMPGIDPELITHKLNVDPNRKSVKQKKRSFAPERQEAIKQEVEKLLEAGFIEEI